MPTARAQNRTSAGTRTHNPLAKPAIRTKAALAKGEVTQKRATSRTTSRATIGRSAATAVQVSTAVCHKRVRSAHATETAEDYTEVIADLIAINGEARVVDVARKLGVSHVTVTRTVARLQRDGWLKAQPYRAIFLTDAGAKLAVRAKRRHDAVVRFLIALGVDELTAHADAEGIEHHVSPKTLAALERFAARAE